MGVVFMPSIIVIYDSRGGFTERMAKAVVEGAKGVRGVEVEVFKLGTPFSISKLDSADAIILGSPTIYGSVTPEMRDFLESIKEHQKSKRLKLSGKLGGVFGSYGWDGGLVIERLSAEMKSFGIRIAAPVVSVSHERYEVFSIVEESLQMCRDLGRTIAERVTGKP